MNYFENEIMRRVKELDCSAVYRERDNEISVMYNGVKIAEISYETAEKISGITDEESEKFLYIKRLCANVSNYCNAYEIGEPINIPDFSDGYRIIYQVGGAKMAARSDRKSGFEFVVWSCEEYPCFFASYDKAREKFAILSGLVDREKIFDDEELETLCYCVYAVSEMCEILLTEDMVKAIASANLDDCFAVKNIRVVEGKNGLFVSMPAYKGQDGEYHDLCFPTTPELRKQLNGAVADAYKQAIVQLQEQSTANFSQTEQSYEAAPTMSM